MITILQVTDELWFGPQPAQDDLRQLAEQGFRGVISLRHDGEDDQPAAPAEEGAAVRKLGLAFVNFPVILRNCRPETVDRFRAELERIPKPVYVHCKRGGRAGGMVIMDLAVRQRMSGEQALARARELGVDLGDERLVTLIKEYADAHRPVRT